jgi:hypothetical protein
MGFPTGCGDVPEPMLLFEVLFPSDCELVPHSNQASVAKLLGFTLLFRFALSAVIELAPCVVV